MTAQSQPQSSERGQIDSKSQQSLLEANLLLKVPAWIRVTHGVPIAQVRNIFLTINLSNYFLVLKKFESLGINTSFRSTSTSLIIIFKTPSLVFSPGI